MNNEDLFDFAKKATIGLHHLNGTCPDGIASGCLINYLNKTIILTVAHAVAEGGWGVKLEITPDLLQIYYRAQYTLMSQGKINISNIEQGSTDISDIMIEPKMIDFAFANLPNEFPVFDEYLDYNKGIKYFRPKHIFITNLQDIPTSGKNYAFYGETKPTINEERKQIVTVPKFINNVKFLCSENEFHIFKLPFTVYDAKELRGCSGAPIFDEDCVLVSLVVGCRVGTDKLFGISLNKFKIAIDIDNGMYN
jgi:hypothetical protein